MQDGPITRQELIASGQLKPGPGVFTHKWHNIEGARVLPRGPLSPDQLASVEQPAWALKLFEAA